MKASNQPIHRYSSIFIHFTASKSNAPPPPPHLPCYTRQTNWVVVFRTRAIRRTQSWKVSRDTPSSKKSSRSANFYHTSARTRRFLCFFSLASSAKIHLARLTEKARSPKTPRIKALRPPEKMIEQKQQSMASVRFPHPSRKVESFLSRKTPEAVRKILVLTVTSSFAQREAVRV